MIGFKRYQSRPVTIRAMQFTGKDTAAEIIRMTTGVREEKTVDQQGNLVPCLIVETIEGEMQAALGWWVIIGTEGEVYPCKDSVFQTKYQEVAAEIPQ